MAAGGLARTAADSRATTGGARRPPPRRRATSGAAPTAAQERRAAVAVRPRRSDRSRSCSVGLGTASHGVCSLTSRLGAPHPSYRRDPAKTVAPLGYNWAMPVPCRRRFPRRSPIWPPGCPTGAGGVPDDQLGTLNLIDRAARLRGVAAVRDGDAFALGLPLSAEEGIQMGFIPGRVNPTRTMVCVNEPMGPDPGWIAFSEDVVTMAMQCATHWDGLAHAVLRRRARGRPPLQRRSRPRPSPRRAPAGWGSTWSGRWCHGACCSTWPGPRALEILEPGYPITPDDLDAACALGGVTVEPGDVVLVRTGQIAHLALPGPAGPGRGRPGPGPGGLHLAHARADHGHRRVVPRPRRGRGGHRHPGARGLSRARTPTSTSRCTSCTWWRWG